MYIWNGRPSFLKLVGLFIMDVNKARAIVNGLAIGDALGYPTEFMSLPEIKGEFGVSGICDLPNQALFSDDTQMSIVSSLDGRAVRTICN
jgi:hypothetical protein